MNDARTFARPPTLEKKACELAGFVKTVIESFPNDKWRARVRFRPKDRNLTVPIDEGELRHALMELLENSQGFKQEGAHITVGTGRASNEMKSYLFSVL